MAMDRQIKKKKWTLKRILWILLGIFILGAVIMIVVSEKGGTKLNVQRERLTISTIRRGPFQEFIAVTGNVIPIRTVYLDAVEGGTVDKLYLEAGNFVQKNDPILRLSNTNLLLDIMYREAELFQQSNNLRNTRLAMEQSQLQLRGQLLDLNYQIQQQRRVRNKNEELHKKGLISDQEWEESRDRYDYLVRNRELTLLSHKQDSVFREQQIIQLEASLRRMENNLDLVKQNLENLTIKAPVSGQLTSLNAEIGRIENRGQRIGQIDVLDGFKVRVPIDEYYISRINAGQKGTFTFASQNYSLTIDKIYPEVLSGRFEVDMLFDGREPDGIRRGQSVYIRLELGDLSEAVLLPKGGFYQKTGGQWIYVIDPGGEFATKRPIRLGRMNPELFEVIDGLTPGDQVITSSYDNYGDADKLILK